MAWIQEQAGATDIFCFQEVPLGSQPVFSEKRRLNLFSEIDSRLPDFTGYAYPAKKGSYFGGHPLPSAVDAGEAIFVKTSLLVVSSGGFRTYAQGGSVDADLRITVTGNCQHVTVQTPDDVLITTVHGLWQGNTHKRDTPERLYQSQTILTFFKEHDLPKILCGDFNLMSNTESVRMLERSGLRNLIQDFSITDTRGPLYTKELRFADYVFVSPQINVRSFSVPVVSISDHLPMVLDF